MKLTTLDGATTIHETTTVLLPIGDLDQDGENQKYLSLNIQTLPLDIDLTLAKEVPGETPEAERLQNVAMIYKSLAPGQVVFDVADYEEKDGVDKTDFYRDILNELTGVGFSVRHFTLLLTAIIDLNGMTAKDVEAVEQNFTTGPPEN